MIERIVQINDLSTPKGGASKLAVQAACSLARKGHRVTFVTGDEGRSMMLAGAGVDVVALGQRRLKDSGRAWAMVNGLWNRPAHALLQDWIRAHDTPATVYHLHGWAQILSPSIFAALDPVRDRLVISAHDFFLACPNGAFAWMKSGQACPHVPLSGSCLTTPCDRDGAAQKAWRSIRQAMQKLAFRPQASPPILAIHDAMHPLLARAGIPPDAITTLPNPVEPFTPCRIEAERNREVLFIGRLELSKGADLAATAAARAGAALTVIGEGPLAERIRQIHPQAQLAGRLDPAQIGAIAKRARMLVMPSRYPEPFGLVAMEAAWSGLPVVLPDTALLAADIVTSGAGLTANPRDINALAAAMRRLLDDDDLTHRMSKAAYNGTRSLGMTADAWVEQIEAVLMTRIEAAGRHAA